MHLSQLGLGPLSKTTQRSPRPHSGTVIHNIPPSPRSKPPQISTILSSFRVRLSSTAPRTRGNEHLTSSRCLRRRSRSSSEESLPSNLSPDPRTTIQPLRHHQTRPTNGHERATGLPENGLLTTARSGLLNFPFPITAEALRQRHTHFCPTLPEFLPLFTTLWELLCLFANSYE